MLDNRYENIYNAIQNLYKMDYNTWQEVLGMMYNLVADTSKKFDVFEQKFDIMLGHEVTESIKLLHEQGNLSEIINNEIFSNLNSEIKYINNKHESTKNAIYERLNTKANETDLIVERNRINNLVALPPSADNAETTDIRIGADGTVYGSAGQAVREQVNYLKEKDYNVNNNNFTPDYVLNKGYLNYKGSVSTENTTFNYSNKIKLLAGQTIRVGTTSIPNNVTVIAEYKAESDNTPLVIADSREFKYYYYQAKKDMYIRFCIYTQQKYTIDITYSITNQLFNSFFNMETKKNSENTNFNMSIANDFEIIDNDLWKQGYYNVNGKLSTEVGIYANLHLEPNTKYIVVLGGFIADVTIVGLDNIEDITGKILKSFNGRKTHILSFTTTESGIVGICTNNSILDKNQVFLSKDFGLLKDVVNSLLDNKKPNIFEVEYRDDKIIPAILKNGNLLIETPKYKQGYWNNGGSFKTETSISFSVQLEPNTSYFVYVGGYSQNNTSIVELNTLEITDGSPIALIKNGANMIEFRTSQTGIIGICTNEKYVDRKDVLIFKKEVGLLTQILLSFIDDKIETFKDIECYVGSTLYQNKKYYYTDPVSCFKDIQNYKGHKIVHIYSGIYDIYELMGGYEYFSKINPQTQKWTDVQPVLDDIEIICHGHVEFNMDLPLTLSSEIRWLISPLNLRGDFDINNLIVNARNTRYCIHDESSGNFPGTIHKYNNVYCKINSNQAVGCGYSKNSTINIRNCYFESGNHHAYSYHSKGGCNIIIENSILKSNGGVPLRLSEENSKIIDKAVISNTTFISSNNHKITIRGEWDYENPVGYTDIKLINTNVKNSSQIKNEYTSNTRNVIAYDTKEGTETILIQKS